MEVSVREARRRLSELLLRVAAGEEITIARAGSPVAKLIPFGERARRVIGADRGLFRVPEDFDSPLDRQALAPFEDR